MGVVRLGPTASAVLWAAAVALAAVIAPLQPVRVGLAVVLAGTLALVGRPWFGPKGTAALTALGAAPIILAALMDGGPAAAGVLAATVVLIGGGTSVLPRVLILGLAALGVVLALRQASLSPALASAGGMIPGLILAGLGTAGAAAVPPYRLLPSVVVAAGLWSAGLSWRAAKLPVAASADVARLARLSETIAPTVSLVERPALGLAAVAAAPGSHALALALVPHVGLDRVLSAGWRPHGAALPAAQRIEAALWLEGMGRGGQARRLLYVGRRDDPTVAWWAQLLARDQSMQTWSALGVPTERPEGVAVAPGRVAWSVDFYQNGAAQLDLDLTASVEAFTLETWSEGYRGPAALTLRACGGPPRSIVVPEGDAEVRVPGPFAAGPCRVRVRFDGDLQGPDGDRNVGIRSVSAG